MIDIKRYLEESSSATLSVPTAQLSFVENATVSQPPAFVAEQQIDTTGKVYVSNMGLDAEAGVDDRSQQHFCYDCCMPFRETRMVLFRGKWYGVPCGDYKHAVDIYRKERQRMYRPPRRKEPGGVPFVTTTSW